MTPNGVRITNVVPGHFRFVVFMNLSFCGTNSMRNAKASNKISCGSQKDLRTEPRLGSRMSDFDGSLEDRVSMIFAFSRIEDNSSRMHKISQTGMACFGKRVALQSSHMIALCICVLYRVLSIVSGGKVSSRTCVSQKFGPVERSWVASSELEEDSKVT